MSRWLDRVQPPSSWILAAAGAVLGVSAAGGIWAFRELFEGLAELVGRAGPWALAAPTVGGLLVGLVVTRLIGEERHHGVAGIMEAVALAGGRLRYQRMPLKAGVAALSIGCGASVGPEDPSVQIGANLGSMLGQWLRLSEERVRTLTAAGVAAGIAAAFNAPIAGVFFALEIVLGEIGGGSFATVVLASVVSSTMTQAISGAQPAFAIPDYPFKAPWELLFFGGLGALAGPLSALYGRALSAARLGFQRLGIVPWLRPAVAGVLVAAVGWRLPEVLGVGYETVEASLNGELPSVGWLLLLLVAKLVLTPVCLGAGFQGGLFAPALFLGATLGGAYGMLAAQLFPGLGLLPPAFAVVGMAAVLAGAVHAPLTAILMVFELTNDYRVILPLMFAVVVSVLLSQRLERDSVYARSLAAKGVRLARGRDVEVLETLSVAEVMETPPTFLREVDSLAEATDRLFDLRAHGLPVLDAADRLVGVVSIQDISRAGAASPPVATVGECCTREVLVAHPDETLDAALRRMSVRDVGRLPVVPRSQPRQLVGTLRRGDVTRAYAAALSRRAALRHRAQQARLGVLGGVEVEEVELGPSSDLIGQQLQEVRWPRESLIATVRRQERLILPHGDTRFEAGDVLVVVGEESARRTARAMVEGATGPEGERESGSSGTPSS